MTRDPTNLGQIRVDRGSLNRGEWRADLDSGVAGMIPSRGFMPAGAIAGAASVVVFTVVHDLIISDIWWMLGPMVVAGALSGLCLAWTFERLFQRRSIATWVAYNAAYLAMFGALAAASVIIFEPVTTMAAISAEGGPVDELIVRALPLAGAFTLGTTGVLGRLLSRRWSDYLRLLLVITVLMVFLGLNVSVLGLVEFSGDALTPVVVFFGLIVLLDLVFAAVFAAILWRRFVDSV